MKTGPPSFSILGLLAFELIGAARNFNTVVAPTTVYPKTPGIDYLLRQKPPFRVIQDGAMGAHPYGFRASVDRWIRFNNFRSPLLEWKRPFSGPVFGGVIHRRGAPRRPQPGA